MLMKPGLFTLAGWRWPALGDAESVKKLFDDIAPRYTDRPGGYTRMHKLGQRLGDASEMVLLELVED
jgi:large subunit ribosomal protein L17